MYPHPQKKVLNLYSIQHRGKVIITFQNRGWILSLIIEDDKHNGDEIRENISKSIGKGKNKRTDTVSVRLIIQK